MNVLDLLSRMTIGRSLLVGILLAAFYYFLMFDNGVTQQNGITQTKTAIADVQKKILDDQAKLDRAAVYKKTAAEVGTTINKLLGVIPEQFSVPEIMKIVSNEAKVAGSSLTNIIPGTPEISKVAVEFEEFSVAIDMSGSFLQHMVFLSNLTKVNQILIVRKFNLTQTSQAKADESPLVHMTANIVAYRYRGANATAVVAPGMKPGAK